MWCLAGAGCVVAVIIVSAWHVEVEVEVEFIDFYLNTTSKFNLHLHLNLKLQFMIWCLAGAVFSFKEALSMGLHLLQLGPSLLSSLIVVDVSMSHHYSNAPPHST